MIWGEIQTLVPDADVVDVCSLREYERAHDYNVVISTVVIENEKDLIFEILKYLHKKHCLRMLLLKMPVYLTIRIYNKCFGND